MTNQISKERICNNCRYFSQHYTKQGLKYKAICYGHCVNINNKKMKPIVSCEYYEDIEIKKEERRRAAAETIELIYKQLNEIVLILSEDNESIG